jgi:hypothetical protein
MRKHEINYHKKIDIIEFTSRFCIHSRRIKTKMTNKKKKIFFEKESSFFNQSNHVKFDILIKNSRKLSTIVIKNSFSKLILIDEQLIFLEKTKNRSIKLKIRKRLKISNLILMNSRSLIRKRKNHCQK